MRTRSEFPLGRRWAGMGPSHDPCRTVAAGEPLARRHPPEGPRCGYSARSKFRCSRTNGGSSSVASMSSSLSVLPAMGHNRGREGVMHALGQRVLINAARKLGGPELLAKHLGVEDAALRAWIDGEQDLQPR